MQNKTCLIASVRDVQLYISYSNFEYETKQTNIVSHSQLKKKNSNKLCRKIDNMFQGKLML